MFGRIHVPIRTNFEAQTKEQKKDIHLLFENEKEHVTAFHKQHMSDHEFYRLDIKLLSRQRTILPFLLSYYQAEVDKLDPASFRFLTPEQKIRLRNQLIHTFYLVYAQHQLDSAEGRRYKLKKHQQYLYLCVQRIGELETGPVRGESTTVEAELEIEINLATKALKYLGLCIAQWFVEKINQFMDNHTGTLVEWMSELNGLRLYWVWGGAMLAILLQALPDSFGNKTDAQRGLAAPAPITGYISWVLYYLRFGIHAGLLLNHTFLPSKEESHIEMWERFTTQWQQRKFALLNDSIWGVANMLCYFWLIGSGSLGFAGNIVCLGLLLMDVTLTAWRFWEEKTKHNAEMAEIARDKERLTTKIKKIEMKRLEEYTNLSHAEILQLEQKQADLEEALAQLEDLESKAQLEWKYKEFDLTNELVYTVGLMLAFVVACSFFLPPTAIAPATALFIALAGATLCFVLTVISAGVKGGIEIAKSKETAKVDRAYCEKLLERFKGTDDPNTRQLLYLEIKAKMANSEYQQRVARFQAIKLIRSALIDSFIPVIVFISISFLPLAPGAVPLLAAAFVMVLLSNWIVNRFEPKAQQLPEFDEKQFDAFEKNPSLAHFEPKKESSSSNKGLLSWLKNRIGNQEAEDLQLTEPLLPAATG